MSWLEFETIPFAEALLRGAEVHPDRDCIVVSNGRVTCGALEARARVVRRSFIALGIQRGDRVGILMANSLDYTDILFGASLIGAIPVLYNARFKAQVFLGDGHRDDFMDRDTFYSHADAVDPIAVDGRHAGTRVTDTALMFYTSGTTAMPKGCPLDHIVLQHAGVVGGADRLRLN